MKVTLIPPDKLDSILGSVSKYIENAIEYSNNEVTIDSIVKELYTGYKQLWVISDDRFKIVGACVTELSNYPNKRVVRIILLGGTGLDSWAKLVSDTIGSWGKGFGATAIEVIGRKGWIRVLEKQGYKLAYFHLLKEV